MSSTSTTADPPSGSSIAAGGVRTRAEAAAAAAAATTPPPPAREGEVEIVDAGGGDAGVPVIAPAAVYNKNGEPHAVDAAVVKAVDDFTVPAGSVTKGSREKSYMYSLGVYIEASNSDKHQFFCMADSLCRRKNKMIPCKGGDRSNVNSHLKNGHGVHGVGGVVKDGKRKAANQSITANFAASKNSGVGTDRVRQLLAVKMVVKKFSPFSFFSSGTTWPDLTGLLTAQDTRFPGQIPMIAANNIRSCLPARFHGRDSDLMAAEAIFDVLSNTAPPSVDDIDMED